jgi:beta-glucosidase
VTHVRDGGLRVSFTITNRGAAGEDVPQVYLGAPSRQPSGVQFAVKALAGFDRVRVGAHRSIRVTLDVSQRDLSYWSTANEKWTLAKGIRTLYVGPSERDVRLATDVTIR